ncbi:hypothetical protein [Dongia sp.]|uniref:hypothetical protein n=1 Tax=Dongia sp. TaxID=1977262 RepID=UPI0035AE90F2
MRYDIYRRDNLMLVFESGRPPNDMNLSGWKRVHMGVTALALSDGSKPVAQIDKEITQNGMTTYQIKNTNQRR